MNKMSSFDEIIAAVSAKRREYLAQPGIRRGQALFNAVAAVVPIYAERIRGSHIDPFYKKDEDLNYHFYNEFWAFIEAQLSKDLGTMT